MKNLIFLVFFFHLQNVMVSQTNSEIKSNLINANNISTEIWNYGSISTPGAIADVRDFVWNKLGYMYEFGTLISAEVVNNDGDTLHITSDSFISPFDGDYDIQGNTKWGWLPTPGYSNSIFNEIANSRNRDSWPEVWSEWNGEYGWGKIIADNEIYYVMNDFSNAEFNYTPSIANPLMKGLGVSSEVRIYQFGGGLKDALIIKYFIKNDSEKPLNKIYFGFQADPHIGGAGDFNDDVVRLVDINFDNLKVNSKLAANTIYLFDYNFLGRGGKIPGYLSFKFLETPEDLGLTSFHSFGWSTILPKDDEKMWELFTSGIDTLNEFYNTPSENEIHFGTGPFSLNPNETKVIKLAIFLSHNYVDLLEDAAYISLQHNWSIISSQINTSGGNDKYQIQLIDIPNIVSDYQEISWQYDGIGTDTKVFLEYSPNKGDDWFPLAVSLDVNDKFIWNTNEAEDGANYILRIIGYNENNPKEYYYYVSSAKFAIDNPNFNAKPELELISNFTDTLIQSSPIKIEWLSEDADDSELNIKIEYSFSLDGPFAEVVTKSFANGLNYFIWDIKELPNSQNYFIRITASDGEKESSLITNPFSVNIFENNFTDAHIKNYRGNATPIIQIQAIDNYQLTNDEYSILFHVNGEIKTFDIKNVTTQKVLLYDYVIDDKVSTPLIEGMKITVIDRENDIDYKQTRYTSNTSNYVDFNIVFPPVLGANKIKLDNDYLIIFNDFDTLSNGDWVYADTMETLLGTITAPFSIWNISGTSPNFDLMEPAAFVLYEYDPNSYGNERWDKSDEIILQPQGTVEPTTSYQISFKINDNNRPQKGDSLYIITFNTIENNDEFRFSPDSNFVVKVKTKDEIDNFNLFQNYPNPFNPTTTITYSIPSFNSTNKLYSQQVNKLQHVNLSVYDVLGNKIKTLVDENKSPGTYNYIFNASDLSTGIYFYRLLLFNDDGKNYVLTKKMLLIK